jgi:hypothetical protein
MNVRKLLHRFATAYRFILFRAMIKSGSMGVLPVTVLPVDYRQDFKRAGRTNIRFFPKHAALPEG